MPFLAFPETYISTLALKLLSAGLGDDADVERARVHRMRTFLDELVAAGDEGTPADAELQQAVRVLRDNWLASYETRHSRCLHQARIDMDLSTVLRVIRLNKQLLAEAASALSWIG